MRIGVIGTGVIASAVIEGIADDGHYIAVSERSADHAARLANQFGNVRVLSNADVIAASDVIFLGLMAPLAPSILAPLAFRSDQRVISLMANATREDVGRMVTPAQVDAVMIPFPGIANGGSPILVRGDTGLVEELFGQSNTLFPLSSDAELDAYLCAQAVLSPATKLAVDTANWLAGKVDDPAQGEAFLRQLVGSSILGSDLGPLLAALSTPGGYNAQLREHMDAAGMPAAVREGLDRLAQG